MIMGGVSVRVIPMDEYKVEDLLYDGIGFPLYYDSDEDIFYQEGGWIETQIDIYADERLLSLFKERKESMCIDNKRMGIILLLYN